ncbi:spore germination protein [Metabacillus sediminilitoris]|uniref:Spore germination protein n=2 Tax=Metabacillus sediminilitoris TaxID=2567941 RepID=A0A4S4BT95_9BACI|nr:spore germination protein [Metabacillus sediminilitoris]THF78308.1 spore germination protein [Metabacillus sediminilitoris]
MKLLNSTQQAISKKSPNQGTNINPNDLLTGMIEEDFYKIKRQMEGASDFSYRKFKFNTYTAIILYLDGLVDMKRMESNIIDPLLNQSKDLLQKDDLTINEIEDEISSGKVKIANTIQQITDHVLAGGTVLLINSLTQSLLISEQSWEKRSVEEPASEAVVLGPREGFTENIRTNTSMIRRRIKSSNLKLESMKIGKLSKTEVVITYIEGIAESSLVEEVRTRLKRIDIDAIEDSGYILEFIEDKPYSVFPQVLQTERPDRVVGNLLEGRVSIIVENSPFALVVPVTFFQMMNSPEDYYGRFIMATFIRMIRYLFLHIALLFPSIYIAVTTFHQELLPTNLLFSVAASREKVPFPAIVEALLMEITFEALREAGLRLPRPIGSTVSIVGALVIGQAAVEAGIVSAPLVIVVSITGIASFMFPSYSMTGAIRLLRFIMMFLAAFLGFYGILLGVFFILVHLVQLRSFGVPYLAPLAPFNFNNMKDILIRAPWWKMNERPEQVGKSNLKRLGSQNRKN